LNSLTEKSESRVNVMCVQTPSAGVAAATITVTSESISPALSSRCAVAHANNEIVASPNTDRVIAPPCAALSKRCAARRSARAHHAPRTSPPRRDTGDDTQRACDTAAACV
jgi:hypothetical protein